MVIPHVPYFLSTCALAEAMERPDSSSSALSSPKYTGFNGESRLRSSNDLLVIESSGSPAATGTLSSTRSAGGGGVGGTTAASSAGGGCGPVATFFLPHAAVTAMASV